MAVKPTAPRVMNGKWGMVYLDGEPVYETDSYEAKLTIEREDVDFVGKMAKDSKTSNPQKKEKKVNKTWEAFGKWKGAFTILDPKFLL